MNYNIFTIILSIIMSALILIASENLKKEKKQKTDDSIQNKLNNPFASAKEIKLAYTYETGKSPFYTNHKEGTSLEYEIFKTLYRYEGKVLSNLYVGKIDKTDTEIDIVFVHNTGIYVIECKDIRAREIIGDEQEKQWDCIYSNTYRRKVYNPLKQNISHIVALKNAISNKCPHDCYTSIVVINCNNVKSRYNSNFDNYYQDIVNPKKVKFHIDSLIKNRNRVFSDEQVINIYKHLHSNYANASAKVKKAHRIRVQNISMDSKRQ